MDYCPVGERIVQPVRDMLTCRERCSLFAQRSPNNEAARLGENGRNQRKVRRPRHRGRSKAGSNNVWQLGRSDHVAVAGKSCNAAVSRLAGASPVPPQVCHSSADSEASGRKLRSSSRNP
jgi:hypothetical protein